MRRALTSLIPVPGSETRGGIRLNEEDVIRHEAVGPDFDSFRSTQLGHQFQEALVVFFTEERLLPAVSPLSDVMRQTSCNDARQLGHCSRLEPRSGPVKN
jgi:hypothetical protein